MSKKSFIDSVRVENPCSEDWEQMSGNDRVRFCSHCAKSVNNLSKMTRKEAIRLVRASGGNLCIRYIPDPRTKRPMFAEQLLQITRRTPQLAAGVITASVSMSSLAYAQSEPIALPVSEPVATYPEKNSSQVTERAKKLGEKVATGKILGTVTDSNGAVIPNAAITLQNEASLESAEGTTDGSGTYEFPGLQPGRYSLTVKSSGFGSLRREGVQMSDIELTVDFELLPAAMGGVMVSIEYKLPLAQAVADEDADLVRELITQGEQVNGKDENYNKITPLFVAVEHGNLEIVQLLLAAGAKVNARDDDRQTPLMRLDDDATPELVEMLLRHGAKVNLTDKESNTALMFAAERAKPVVVKALIDAGADVNVVNKDGRTALINAADDASIEKVRMLLEAGANVNVKNNDGETASDMTDDEEILDLLVSYGAEVKAKPIEVTVAPQEVEPQTDNN